MIDRKRLLVAVVVGFATGVICYAGGRFGLKDEISVPMIVYILVNRTLIGFVIGISPIRLHWAPHGLLIGVVVGLPFTAGCLLEAGNTKTALAALILGAVYGLLVELFASVVFKAPRRAPRSVGSADATAHAALWKTPRQASRRARFSRRV